VCSRTLSRRSFIWEWCGGSSAHSIDARQLLQSAANWLLKMRRRTTIWRAFLATRETAKARFASAGRGQTSACAERCQTQLGLRAAAKGRCGRRSGRFSPGSGDPAGMPTLITISVGADSGGRRAKCRPGISGGTADSAGRQRYRGTGHCLLQRGFRRAISEFRRRFGERPTMRPCTTTRPGVNSRTSCRRRWLSFKSGAA